MSESVVEGWTTALWWVFFGGSHLALSSKPIRVRLVSALGLRGFTYGYSLVAVLTFAGLVRYVAVHRGGGEQPLLWSTVPPVRGALVLLSVLGFTLFIAGVILYTRAPMALFRHRVVPVRGLLQISRHPFFSGLSVWAGAHVILAGHASTLVFFLGFIVFSIVGAWHQDRRLMVELGEPYRAFVASTSYWPFFAVATKRQHVRWREQPWIAYLSAFAISLGLYQVHPHLFDHDGLYIIGTVSLGAFVAGLRSSARVRQRA